MNSSPALNQKEFERKLDAIKVCGANRGPHDYIPYKWHIGNESKQITNLMCRVCFTRVSLTTLLKYFYEAKMD